MTYELCKQLKDAGFLQCRQNTVYLEPPSNLRCEKGEWVYIPTLSELIEACGDRFIQLSRGDAGWLATTSVELHLNGTPYAATAMFGATPEEAVANLWLALTKSKNT